MSNQCVLLTGAIGLIGHEVHKLLVARGTKVVAIDRIATEIDDLEIKDCDVTDVHGLHSLARRNDFTHIIHCGAFSGPMVAPDHPHQMVQTNIVGAANIAELARLIGGVKVVFASTATAYGVTPQGPVPEETVMYPDTVYGASKRAAEHVFNAYKLQFGVDSTHLRIGWVYGPRRTTACLVRQMLSDALAGKPTHIPYGAEFPRQYMHVSDAARAMVLAMDRRALPQQAYNITAGEQITLGALGRKVMELFPGAEISVAAGDDPGDMRQGLFDISAAARDLDYTPEYTLEKGLTSYHSWLQARLEGASK